MIKSFSIDKNFIYTDKNLNYNNGFYWSDSRESLTYGFDHSNLNELLSVSAENFDIEFPKKYHKIFDQSNYKIKNQSDLFKILSEKDKLKIIGQLTNKIIDNSKQINLNNLRYFSNILPERKNILSNISNYQIDEDKYNNILNSIENETLKSNLISFKNKNKVEYNNFGTITGRLSVSNGANILTLKKDFREIFKSSFNDGKLIFLDFKTLEMNLLLLETKNNKLLNICKDTDIYSYFSTKLNIQRDIVKNIIISIVYGSGIESISKKYELDLLFVEKISEYFKKIFCLEELASKFINEYKITGKITNKFGRSIKIEKSENLPNGNKLINYYLQSTGADITLLLFNKLLQTINLTNIKPIFIIHDCLVLDVEKESIDKILNINSMSYDDIELKISTGLFNNN